MGAYAVSRYRSSPANDGDESDMVMVDRPKSKSWKDSSGRLEGKDGYVFGDLTRGVCVKIWGKTDAETEAAGDAQNTQVQKLLREAVKVYRARGYTGTISLSHTVAYFNESVSCAVKPLTGDLAPWEVTSQDAEEEEASDDGSTDKIADEGKAGLVFATLLARLERRAQSWAAYSRMDGVDPNISQSAQIGFALPVVKLGWGVSVSLTVSTSSLLRWAEHEAALEAAAAEEAKEATEAKEDSAPAVEMAEVAKEVE